MLAGTLLPDLIASVNKDASHVKYRQVYQLARHLQPARPRIFLQAYPLRNNYTEWLARGFPPAKEMVEEKGPKIKGDVDINILIWKVFKRGVDAERTY